jgi:adenylate kinase family enzyme
MRVRSSAGGAGWKGRGIASARRIAVVGPPGSGKTTVARRLAGITGLPLVHLDQLAFRPGWRETPPEELRRMHARLVDEPEWVIDGNFTGVGKAERIARADVAVVLATPRRTCVLRILRRTVLTYGRRRPDMAAGCAERFDAGFLRFCWTWHSRHPDYGAEIARQAGSTPVIVLQGSREVDELLGRVTRASYGAPRSSESSPPPRPPAWDPPPPDTRQRRRS